MGFFGDIERFLAELYPYRWPIVVAGLVVLTALAAWGSHKGWHLAFWRLPQPLLTTSLTTRLGDSRQ